MLITPLHISISKRTGYDWIRAIGKEEGLPNLMKSGSLLGELRASNIGVSLTRFTTIDLQNVVIRIHDFYIERDGRLYMGYDWLNTPLGEFTYEKYYQNPSRFFFVPRIVVRYQSQEIERFITVDTCDHYMNPI